MTSSDSVIFEDILQFTLVYSNGFCFSILSILRPLAPTTWCSMLGTNQKQFPSPEKLTGGSTGAWRLRSTQWTPVNSTPPPSFLYFFHHTAEYLRHLLDGGQITWRVSQSVLQLSGLELQRTAPWWQIDWWRQKASSGPAGSEQLEPQGGKSYHQSM